MRTASRYGAVSTWIVVALALVLSVGGFFAVRWMTRPPETASHSKPAPVVTVEVATAKLMPWPETLELNGTVEAEDRLQIGSEVGGLKIVDVLVEEGEQVYRGQLLARLNTSLLQARLEQLQARYTQQQATLAKAHRPQRPLEVSQLESALRQAEATIEQERANLALAQAALNNAEANLNRYQSLYSQGAVAEIESENRQLEVQRQQAQVRAAEERMEGAKFAARQARERLQLARSGGRQEDVIIAQAQLRELEAQMEEVQAQVAQARITAPAGGWILNREAHLGDIASPGTVLFEIAREGQLQLSGSVPETEVARINPGMPVAVSHAGREVQATVARIAPLVDPQTRNAEVLIDLPVSSGLRPGMFCSATIDLGTTERITIPLEAVLGESPEYYVYVLRDQTAQRVPVEVADRRDGRASVTGLAEGTEVVIEGGGFLRDGDTVAKL